MEEEMVVGTDVMDGPVVAMEMADMVEMMVRVSYCRIKCLKINQ